MAAKACGFSIWNSFEREQSLAPVALLRLSKITKNRRYLIEIKVMSHSLHTTGTAVFLGGLKNGIATTFAETVRRTASTVISIAKVVPTADCSRLTQASAIIFFSVGDHVVEVANAEEDDCAGLREA